MTTMANATGRMRLTDVRAHAAAALAPESDDDPEVILDVVDSLTPPALMLIWADPWLQRTTVGATLSGGLGGWNAWFEILCVSGRADPGAGLTKLEELVGFVLRRLMADERDWPEETFYAPRRFTLGGIEYLAARMIFKVPVTI